MGIISFVMTRLFRAEPFESKALDRLAEIMKVTPILKRGTLSRYYKSRFLPIGCLSYSDALVFNSKYYGMLLSDEVLAVGAHEFNHIIEAHIVKRLPRTVLPAVILAILTGCLTSINFPLINTVQLFTNLDRGLFIALATVFSLLFFLTATFYVNARWLRQQETECDLSAVEFVNGEAVISALEKLRPRKIPNWEFKLSKLMPKTYPTLEQRIHDVQIALGSKKST